MSDVLDGVQLQEMIDRIARALRDQAQTIHGPLALGPALANDSLRRLSLSHRALAAQLVAKTEQLKDAEKALEDGGCMYYQQNGHAVCSDDTQLGQGLWCSYCAHFAKYPEVEK
jgi:hypothetical protein